MITRDYAKRIPDLIRSKRLMTEADPIKNAIAVASNPQMQLLAEIWYEYIEPGRERSMCPFCLDNILSNFRMIKPILIELENDFKKLELL